MTAVTPGLGTLLEYESATPGTFVTIGQRVTISGPNITVGEDIITHLDSTAVERRATLVDGGKVTCQIEFIGSDTTHAALVTALLAKTVKNWKLVFSTGTPSNWAFSGFLSSFSPSGMEVEGHLLVDIEISITGLPVFTP